MKLITKKARVRAKVAFKPLEPLGENRGSSGSGSWTPDVTVVLLTVLVLAVRYVQVLSLVIAINIKVSQFKKTCLVIMAQ